MPAGCGDAVGSDPSPSPAVCVHCGRGVAQLYRRYSATVLKLTACAHCGQVADKYVEYDPVLVLLDLVLLNRQAIRHILYNTEFGNHWKLCVVMVLIEGYVAYSAVRGGAPEPWPDPPDPPHMEVDCLFYVVCVEALVAAAAFLAATALGCAAFCRAAGRRRPAPLLLVKALVLGSLAVFLWVPALIWTGPARRWVDAAFIGGYMFLTLVQTVSVICDAPRLAAALVAALGLAAKAAARAGLRTLDRDALADLL